MDLSPDAARLRAEWIFAVRRYHEARTGRPVNYQSKVCWDGGYDERTGRRYKSVWQDLYNKIREAGFQPVELINAIFSGLTTDNVPRPIDLAGPQNIQRALQIRKGYDWMAASTLSSEEGMFRIAYSAAEEIYKNPEEALKRAIDDTSRDMSALFRYCLARLKGYADVAARWKLAAERQFDKAPQAYASHWTTILPADLLKSYNDTPTEEVA